MTISITHVAVGSKIQYQGVELTLVKDLNGGYRLMGEDGKYKCCDFYPEEPCSIEYLTQVIKRQVIL